VSEPEPGTLVPVKPPPLRVVVDTREQQPWTMPDGVEVVRRTLPSGDYALDGHERVAIVERKSLADFVGCCTSGRDRFERELVRLAALPHAWVIVESDVGNVWAHTYRSSIAPASVMGSVAAWTVRHVPILFASDRKGACDLALRLLRQAAAQAEYEHAQAAT
jgi:DNA excision repair protein ERCC-4